MTEPKLAPPGAGLPKAELVIARFIFAWRLRKGNRDSFNARFQAERRAIRAMVDSSDAETGSRRVLIERCRGLEDSSRYWSVWMVLDHLRIVNADITRIIESLARGVAPPGTASTAKVKPSLNATAAVLAEHENACDKLLATIASVADLKTAAKYAHPWFGPLDGAGWHALAAGHMGIHRVQMERISARLDAKNHAV
jgi:DinB superfamily